MNFNPLKGAKDVDRAPLLGLRWMTCCNLYILRDKLFNSVFFTEEFALFCAKPHNKTANLFLGIFR